MSLSTEARHKGNVLVIASTALVGPTKNGHAVGQEGRGLPRQLVLGHRQAVLALVASDDVEPRGTENVIESLRLPGGCTFGMLQQEIPSLRHLPFCYLSSEG